MTPANERIQESDWGASMVKRAQFYNQTVACVENIVVCVPLLLEQ